MNGQRNLSRHNRATGPTCDLDTLSCYVLALGVIAGCNLRRLTPWWIENRQEGRVFDIGSNISKVVGVLGWFAPSTLVPLLIPR